MLRDDYTNPVYEEMMPTAEMLQCIKDCTGCHTICLRTAMHFLQIVSKHTEATHLRLMLDCADICETNANFMVRGSNLHRLTCAVCADVCEQCAQECERFGEDGQMKACADACRTCAASCRRMSGK